ncbi:hypothetical protein B0H19DRAFT_1077183 [Mycena capillaripes]|nr:hypothetical protein B0H19DRAFT_1077183 [Mycena capillaripes]
MLCVLPHPFIPTEDKALKLGEYALPLYKSKLDIFPEALRNGAQSATPRLRAWLDHYRLSPDSPRAPDFHERKRAALVARVAAKQHLATVQSTPSLPSRPPDFHERKRAALVARVAARKQRLDNLLELRARAIKASARKWPPPRCHIHHKENIQLRDLKQRQEEA